MHEENWAGVEVRLLQADHDLHKMQRALDPPEQSEADVAFKASGAIDERWHDAFYSRWINFRAAARGVPETIQRCFGADIINPAMKDWFHDLPAEERDRRNEFTRQFKDAYTAFSALPLSTTAGNIGVRPTGHPPMMVRGQIDPAYAGTNWPKWDDLEIDGQPLPPACKEYLESARILVSQARAISEQVHQGFTVSTPPRKVS